MFDTIGVRKDFDFVDLRTGFKRKFPFVVKLLRAGSYDAMKTKP